MNNIGHQTIVVGIDGSANSDAALDWAVAEASRRNCRLHLFSAGNSQSPTGEAHFDASMYADFSRATLAVADERLAAASVRAHALSLASLDITVESAAEGAAGGLVALSARADSIVLGRSGHGPLVGAVLGSVAHQVVTHAQCPIVVVHDSSGSGSSRNPRGVAVGIDGSAGSQLALGYAFDQASLRGVPLDVIHAWWTSATGGMALDFQAEQVTHARQILSETLVGWAEKYPEVNVREHLPVGPTCLSITESAKDADLLVVGSRGRGGFRSLLLGSVSQGVLRQATCTVVVVRARSAEVAL